MPDARSDSVASSLLTAFLTEHDHPCPQCEYNLRNLQGTRCPECGEELVLRVNATEPRQGLLIAGLIGLSAGAGLNGLLLIYGVIMSLRGIPGAGAMFWNVCGLGLLVEGGALLVWLKAWRAIRKQTLSMRTILASACWLVTLLDILIFSFTIR